MGNIVLLDELTINQIAAGEVIERPASVVKEMVENSIDAGAKHITVEIKNGGISFIKISDDGKGISKDDVPFAFERHATSKIRCANDLQNVKSMGFRGEALASISAISNVELVSKQETDAIGTRIVVEGGKTLSLDDIGCSNGTTITVRNLFYNTPVRYKFLKRDFTESGYIEDVMTRVALVHPEISVKYINAGKTVFSTNGSDNLTNAIYSIFGKETASSLINVNYETQNIKISGVIGKPNIARANRSNQIFFVNSRYVKDKTLNSASEQAFKNILPFGKFPFLVLNIEIPPSMVDVNVHPAKLEVRFSDENTIFKAVYNALKNTLLKINHPSITTNPMETQIDTDSIGVQKEKISSNIDSSGTSSTDVSSSIREFPLHSNILEKLKLIQDSIKYESENNPNISLTENFKNIIENADNFEILKTQDYDIEPSDENIVSEVVSEPSVENVVSEVISEPSVENVVSEVISEPSVENAVSEMPSEPLYDNNISDVILESTDDNNVSEVVSEPSVENYVSEVISEPSVENVVSEVISEPSVENAVSEVISEPSVENAVSEVISEPSVENAVSEMPSEPLYDNNISDVILESTDDNNVSEIVSEPSVENTVSEVVAEPSVENTVSEVVAESPNENTVSEVVSEQTDEDSDSDLTFRKMYLELFGKEPYGGRKIEEENTTEKYYTLNKEDFSQDNISLFENNEDYKSISYKYIGSTFENYIIVEISNELYILDQRLANEKIMCEKIKKTFYNSAKNISQMLLLPDIISLDSKQMAIAKDNFKFFAKAGFTIEEFGENTLKLSGVPEICIDLDTESLFKAILEGINQVPRTNELQKEEKFIYVISSMIVSKMPVQQSQEEIENLIDELLTLPNPFVSSSERPFAIRMSRYEIEKKFARK